MTTFTEMPGMLNTKAIPDLAYNNTSKAYDAEEGLAHSVDTIFMILYGIQGSIAIGTNLLTIIAICKFYFLREDCACRFVASLGLADLIGKIYWSLGRSHYIVWSTRSSDVEKSCPTRKKNLHFILLLFFPLTCTKN